MLKTIKAGNIFKVYDGLRRIDTICHGANMCGVMGLGVAKDIKKKFPANFKRYNNLCSTLTVEELERLGFMMSDYENEYHVFNLFSQIYTGACASPELIQNGLFAIGNYMVKAGMTEIAFPAIGAGIGGLDIDDVKDLLREFASTWSEINVYLVESYSDIVTDIKNYENHTFN